jgi:cysteine peptidase C11 family protein
MTAMIKSLAKRQWTVMIYMAGDNTLDGSVSADLQEMKSVGSGPEVNVVAQVDRAGSKKVTTRYLLRKRTPLTRDRIMALGETNTGDPAVLKDFIVWATTNYPAERYMLVIWNHGSGVDDSNLYEGGYFSGALPPVVRKGNVIRAGSRRRAPKAPVSIATIRAGVKRAARALFGRTVETMVTTRAIAFDDQAKDYLDNMELKRVLTDVHESLGQPIDLLGFDACLMSMLEVSYQLRDTARVACGSEEEEPGDGWPYNTILAGLAAKPSMTAHELASTVVKRYLDSYKADDGVTQSAMDLTVVDSLAHAVNTLGQALSGALDDAPAREKIVNVRAQVQEYTAPYDQYCDLGDLCTLLHGSVEHPGVAAACGGVQKALQKAVIASGAKGAAVTNSHGIAIYFPKKHVSTLYGTLDFAKDTAWAPFIEQYVLSTKTVRR